jgi:hypothetical protein
MVTGVAKVGKDASELLSTQNWLLLTSVATRRLWLKQRGARSSEASAQTIIEGEKDTLGSVDS